MFCFHCVKCFFLFHINDYAFFICHLQWFFAVFTLPNLPSASLFTHTPSLKPQGTCISSIESFAKSKIMFRVFCIMSTTSTADLKCYWCHNGIRMLSKFTMLWKWKNNRKRKKDGKNPFSHIMKYVNVRPLSMLYILHINHHHVSFHIPKICVFFGFELRFSVPVFLFYQ